DWTPARERTGFGLAPTVIVTVNQRRRESAARWDQREIRDERSRQPTLSFCRVCRRLPRRGPDQKRASEPPRRKPHRFGEQGGQASQGVRGAGRQERPASEPVSRRL